MKLYGVYGGTFNPPHKGHILAADTVCGFLGIDRVIIIPAKIPPHKKLPEGTPETRIRYEMTCLAFEDLGYAEVSDMEIMREGRSYTADTVLELERMYPGERPCLIVGTDMLCTLDSWYKPEVILAHADVAAMGREHGDLERIEEAGEALRKKYGAVIHIVNAPAIEISSTQLRSMLKENRSGGYIPEKVMDYIAEKGLYGYNGHRKAAEQNRGNF